MPQRIAPPSNAGPAGAAVETMVSPSLSTISQLVPTSMNRRVRLSRSMPVASMPATMSPPTYAPRAGNTSPGPAGAGRARARRRAPIGGCAVDITNGATPSGSGSMPSDQRGHRGVAGQRHLVDLRRVDAALAAAPGGPARRASRRPPAAAGRAAGVHHRGADPGDHVAAERLLLVEHRATATGVPVVRSSRVATTVVVPRSKAIAYRAPWCRRARRRSGPRRR